VGIRHQLESTDVLGAVYEQRFPAREETARRAVWVEVGRYLQRFIPADARVLDIGSDSGHLIASIRAAEKVATDMRDVSDRLAPGIRFVQANGLELRAVLSAGSFDVVVMSNFLEHLASGDAVIEQLRVAHDLLRSGGRVIVLQPNIRLVKGAYWDFIDHKTALTDRSLCEAATLAGFEHHRVIKRFLPYTTKSRLPQTQWLVRMYLAFPPAWLLMGKQTLYVGIKHSP
jgi:SAM-dependent methyltransferase